MNDTLKVAGRIGAELGAAKAANEKLRGLLHGAHDTIRNLAEDLDEDEFQATIDQLAEIELALAPQQAEPEEVDYSYHSHEFAKAQPDPTDTYTAVDMATAAAQGFRDGQAAVEQAPAQDEQSPEQMLSREQIENIARKVHGDCIRLPGATYQHAAEAAVMYTLERIARPAQTAPQGKFRMGDLVKKSTGSEWEGRVVGWYSTEQTKEGYAVESSAHRNSVQIYPVTALEAVE